MIDRFILAPRYRLDDRVPWLKGIDPSRHYWLMVNSDPDNSVAIPGLAIDTIEQWKQNITRFRCLQPEETMEITRAANSCQIHCIGNNCYAIEHRINGNLVWHLFDRETVESFLMTAHPDWQCAPQDIDLGRKLLANAFTQPAAVKVS